MFSTILLEKYLNILKIFRNTHFYEHNMNLPNQNKNKN